MISPITRCWTSNSNSWIFPGKATGRSDTGFYTEWLGAAGRDVLPTFSGIYQWIARSSSRAAAPPQCFCKILRCFSASSSFCERWGQIHGGTSRNFCSRRSPSPSKICPRLGRWELNRSHSSEAHLLFYASPNIREYSSKRPVPPSWAIFRVFRVLCLSGRLGKTWRDTSWAGLNCWHPQLSQGTQAHPPPSGRESSCPLSRSLAWWTPPCRCAWSWCACRARGSWGRISRSCTKSFDRLRRSWCAACAWAPRSCRRWSGPPWSRGSTSS